MFPEIQKDNTLTIETVYDVRDGHRMPVHVRRCEKNSRVKAAAKLSERDRIDGTVEASIEVAAARSTDDMREGA